MFSRISIAGAVAVAAVAAAQAHSLPLGDGKVSSGPKRGYLFSCQQRFNPNAPGAHARGPWIGSGSWDPSGKPAVGGSVSWPSSIRIALEGSKRVVRSNSLPDHKTGTYPIARGTEAYKYDRNPNRISSRNIVLTLPANPEPAAGATCVPMGMIGFMLSGAALFNAVDAAGRDAPAHEIQDKCNGHPERGGQYHYHNLSPCISSKGSGHSKLIGYALDGFGIYGTRGEGGKTLTNASLDACHGHSHVIEWDGKQVEMYHYHMTAGYPYSIGCFRGKPVRYR